MIDLFFPKESLYIIIPIFILSLCFIKRYLFHILDPFIIQIYALSSSMGLMVWYYFNSSNIKIEDVLIFLLFFVLFLIGFIFGSKCQMIKHYFSVSMRKTDIKLYLKVILVLLLVLYSYMAYTIGIVLLQDDPEIARVSIYQGGGGIFRRGVPILLSLAYLFTFINFHQKTLSKNVFITLLVSLSLLSLTLGGKGTLFPIFFMYLFSFWAHDLAKTGKIRYNKKMMFTGIGLFICIIIGALVILSLSIQSRLTNNDVNNSDIVLLALDLFMNRIIAFGDISYYYFAQQVTLEGQKQWWDFIIDILNNPFGFLRITQYEQALGATIYSKAFGLGSDNSIGPNSQLPFVAMIYFGPIIGTFVMFMIGFFLGAIRKYLYDHLVKMRDIFSIILFILVNYQILAIPTDIFLAIGTIFDFTIVIILTIPIIMLFRSQRCN